MMCSARTAESHDSHLSPQIWLLLNICLNEILCTKLVYLTGVHESYKDHQWSIPSLLVLQPALTKDK